MPETAEMGKGEQRMSEVPAPEDAEEKEEELRGNEDKGKDGETGEEEGQASNKEEASNHEGEEGRRGEGEGRGGGGARGRGGGKGDTKKGKEVLERPSTIVEDEDEEADPPTEDFVTEGTRRAAAANANESKNRIEAVKGEPRDEGEGARAGALNSVKLPRADDFEARHPADLPRTRGDCVDGSGFLDAEGFSIMVAKSLFSLIVSVIKANRVREEVSQVRRRLDILCSAEEETEQAGEGFTRALAIAGSHSKAHPNAESVQTTWRYLLRHNNTSGIGAREKAGWLERARSALEDIQDDLSRVEKSIRRCKGCQEKIMTLEGAYKKRRFLHGRDDTQSGTMQHKIKLLREDYDAYKEHLTAAVDGSVLKKNTFLIRTLSQLSKLNLLKIMLSLEKLRADEKVAGYKVDSVRAESKVSTFPGHVSLDALFQSQPKKYADAMPVGS